MFQIRFLPCQRILDLSNAHHLLMGHSHASRALVKAKKYRRFDQAGSAGAFAGSAATGSEQ